MNDDGGRDRARPARPAPGPVDRATAREYAAWFRALGDPTRVQIVSVLARSGRPLAVGEIVDMVQVGQSTVSQHLRVLAEVRFVLTERRGTARLYRLNSACVDLFPTAAGLVAGHTPPSPASLAGRPPASKPATGRLSAGQPADSGQQARIRPMRPADAAQVLAIYQVGLNSGEASFETEAPSWEEFEAAKLPDHRYVATTPGGRVTGWVAVSPVSGRCVYAGVVEHSVYVDPAARGSGVGAALLAALIRSTEAAGIWTIQSGIFPENTASLRLHERAGFRVVGVRSQIGCRHGRWRDVVLIERRSPLTGTG